jgi:ATP-dependent Clp protease adaptor protein ClpS
MSSSPRASGTSTDTSTETVTETKTDVATLRPWSVIVWDDPVTLMVVVVLILRRVFSYPQAKATQLMMTVHNEGRAVVWSGAREKAENYCVQLQTHGLLASIESTT